MKKSILEVYQRRKKVYERLVKKQEKYINILSNLRLITFVFGTIFTVITVVRRHYFLFIGIALVTAVLFVYLVKLFMKINTNKKYAAQLCKINEDCIKRLKGEWTTFEDNGSEYINRDHNYSYDLDIFGSGSLFQYINTTCTYLGRKKLQRALTEKPESKSILKNIQDSSVGLSKKLWLRQKFEAEGKTINTKSQNPEIFLSWIRKRNEDKLKSKMIYFINVVPIITALTSIVLALRIMVYLMFLVSNINIILPKVFEIIPFYVPILLIIIQFLILRVRRKDRINNLSVAEKYSDNIKAYGNILKFIEKRKFKTSYLIDLQKSLYNSNSINPSKQIDAFYTISSNLSNRRNMIYPVLNVILMLEYRWDIKLEKWKLEVGDYFENWIDVIGQIDYLCCISNINYDNPEWVVPTITDGVPIFKAKNIGHPLLKKEKRVCNSLELEEPKNIMIITGSNMSGKSTLMRTVGINMVLAYAGSSVCADKFYCTIMDIYSSMKISDDLNKNISSFYAEILKIKKITEASKQGKQVFFLLDEIFKGTNSIDRHTGAMVLIKQLSKKGNLGIVSTHDLELSEIANIKDSKAKNFHFSEYYKENKIYFDYKLKPGVSTTRNAIYLMKMAGIDVDPKKLPCIYSV